jgi:hypothetical protein
VTDYTNKLLYYKDSQGLYYISSQNTFDVQGTWYDRWHPEGMSYDLTVGSIYRRMILKDARIIKEGDSIKVDNANVIIIKEIYKYHMITRNSAGIDSCVRYCDFFTTTVPWSFIFEDTPIYTSNKGLSKCFKCSCRTEMRRDFSDFSIREMCPRCKI